MDDADDKVAIIKKHWKVTDDEELLKYMRKVRAHARTYSWKENGNTYSFCKFYQADLHALTR